MIYLPFLRWAVRDSIVAKVNEMKEKNRAEEIMYFRSLNASCPQRGNCHAAKPQSRRPFSLIYHSTTKQILENILILLLPTILMLHKNGPSIFYTIMIGMDVLWAVCIIVLHCAFGYLGPEPSIIS